MEAKEKTFSETAEALQETFKTTAGFYGKTALSILDAYSKQLSASAEWYNNFIGGTAKTDFKESCRTVSDTLKKNLDSYQQILKETNKISREATEKIFGARSREWTSSPVYQVVADAVINIFRKQTELLSNSGIQFLNTLGKNGGFQNYSRQFEEFINDSLKTSEETINKLIGDYNTRAKFTQETSGQLLNAITRQFDTFTETNSDFFNKWLKNFEQGKSTSGWNPFSGTKAGDKNKTNKQ